MYDGNFYILIVYCSSLGRGDLESQIGYIDLKEKNPIILYNTYDGTNTPYYSKCDEANFDIWHHKILYQDKIIFEDHSKKSLVSVSRDKETEKEIITKTTKFGNDSNWFFMDNKIYFEIQKEGKLNLYSYDLEKNLRKKILTYSCEVKDYIRLDMDDRYLYSNNLIIPLGGGKIERKDIYKNSIVHNDRFIFYIDSKFLLHKVDKRNLDNDIVISKTKFLSVYCTDTELYLKKYTKGIINFYDDKDNYGLYSEEGYKINLYTMDFDGTNLQKIVNEK